MPLFDTPPGINLKQLAKALRSLGLGRRRGRPPVDIPDLSESEHLQIDQSSLSKHQRKFHPKSNPRAKPQRRTAAEKEYIVRLIRTLHRRGESLSWPSPEGSAFVKVAALLSLEGKYTSTSAVRNIWQRNKRQFL